MDPGTQAAWEYHDRTKHSPESVRASQHTLDFANQPRPYKLYQDAPAIPLPRDLPGSRTAALDAIADPGNDAIAGQALGLPMLASILHHTAGITKRLRFPGGFMDFRAASCTGALYHIELYVVCGLLPGLEAGVYQFGVHDFALRRLRSDDLRATLVAATAGEPAVAQAPAVLVATSTYWRNAWKYEERTYRHCFWDLGTCLANLLAVVAGHRVPARVILGFVDRDVNRLIDVDGEREAALALVPLGQTFDASPTTTDTIPALNLPTVPLSDHEIEYPAIRAMHTASALERPNEVADWHARAQAAAQRPPSLISSLLVEEREGGSIIPSPLAREDERGQYQPPASNLEHRPLPTTLPDGAPSNPIETVIRKRGSSRRFTRDAIDATQLGTMLRCATQGIPADFLAGAGLELNQAYLIVNAVDGLAPGSYAFDGESQGLLPLALGDFRDRAGYLALNQGLAADAAVNVYFLADLAQILHRLGNRGYRAAQLEASIAAGKLYLAAYALGLGASGLTFFDDDVTTFFSPHAAGKSVVFLIAIGHPVRRARQT